MAAKDELDEELDDPISLMVFEDVKVNTWDPDQIPPTIIDLGESTDDESTYKSYYGKRDFVLPVTFFDISRNVRLLNKCKPMSIKIVDCKQYPTYYSKHNREKNISKLDDSILEGDKNSAGDIEYKSNNSINASKIKDIDVNKQNKERKFRDAFYDKLKKRKERMKQTALNSKNLSQIDFKRNKGLIGLKITGNILKHIVDTEKALIKTKSNFGENNIKGLSENNATKTDSAEDKSNTSKGAVEKPLIKITSKSVENKQTEKCEIDPGNNKSCLAEDKPKKKSETNADTVLLRTSSNPAEDKTKEKSENHKGKSETDTRNGLVRSKSKLCEDKIISETEANNVFVITKPNPDDDKDKDKCKSKDMKDMEAILDALGTSVIPIENTNDHVPQTVNLNTEEHTRVKVPVRLPHAKEKQEKIESGGIKCSLKISPDKIIEKALKHKKSKCDSSNLINATPYQDVEQKLKDIISKDDKKVPKLNLKRSNSDTDNFFVNLDSDKMQCMSPKNTDAGKFDAAKQVEEAIVKNNGRKQEGSNSPVIPCTTLNVSRTSNPNVHAKDSSISNQIPTNSLKIVGHTFSNNNPQFTCLADIKSNTAVHSIVNIVESRFSDRNVANTNYKKAEPAITTKIKPKTSENTAPVNNQTVNGMSKSPNPNISTNLPVNRPQYSGNNAIILRKPPHFNFKTSMFPRQGCPIQTVINHRPPYQAMPTGSRAFRCQFAPRCPPPNNNNINLSQPRPMNQNNFPHFRMPAPPRRGTEMGVNYYGLQSHSRPQATNFRFPPPPPPPPPLPRPPPQETHKNNPVPATVPNVAENSIIGSTKTGELIKKINIVARPANNTVTDKEMMLAELNNAVMSPELSLNKPEDKPTKDLKRIADLIPSKPCPLSKKNDKTVLDTGKFPEKSPPKVGYSPPILPILTYKEAFEILSQSGTQMRKSVSDSGAQNHVFKMNTSNSKLNIKKLDKTAPKRKILHAESGQDKAKKISFADYKKRVKKDDRIDVNKIRKYNQSKNPTDDYNQDQGYDSDSTVIL